MHHLCLQVQADSKRVAREAADAEAVAAECQASLDSALPALAAAEQALRALTGPDIAELMVIPGSLPAISALPHTAQEKYE